jgi:hypothetical protein
LARLACISVCRQPSQPLHLPPLIPHHTAQESACTSSQPHVSIIPALLDLSRRPTQRSPIIQATCSIFQSDPARLSASPYSASRCASSISIPWNSENFIDAERPPYVILSHTWGAEEISLQELQLHVSNTSCLSTKAGYVKILNFCRKGKENGFEWGWIDTCCIDKTSSAELSEAINSMFRVSLVARAYIPFPIFLCEN